MSIGAVIQARLGSTRLPKKVFLMLQGKTVLEHIVNRVKSARNVDDVIVATTERIEDSEIVQFCRDRMIKVFAGSEKDVLDRFYRAALTHSFSHIIRITADCPLLDAELVDAIIHNHIKENADYTSNVLEETFPDGEDIEIMTFEALTKAWQMATLASEREHVTPFIRNNPALFKLRNITSRENLSSKRWTLDEPRDYEFIQAVYNGIYQRDNLFGMQSVLDFLKENPGIEAINQGISRNEGYRKSLTDEKTV